MKACMGGWCHVRDKCPHHVEAQRVRAAERLCLPKRDGVRLVDAGPYRVIAIDVFSGREVWRRVA